MTRAQQAQSAQAQQVFSTRVAILSNEVELDVVAQSGAQSQPTQLRAIVSRANAGVSISWQQW
jgi:hypothetical protein